MGTLQVGGTTLGVKNTSTNKIDLSNLGEVGSITGGNFGTITQRSSSSSSPTFTRSSGTAIDSSVLANLYGSTSVSTDSTAQTHKWLAWDYGSGNARKITKLQFFQDDGASFSTGIFLEGSNVPSPDYTETDYTGDWTQLKSFGNIVNDAVYSYSSPVTATTLKYRHYRIRYSWNSNNSVGSIHSFVLEDTDSTFDARTALNATGDAPIYACRAWVNFNGTGTVAIRASGNVSSITDNGTGDYTVNFTTAMPDANYSTSAFAVQQSGFTDLNITVVGQKGSVSSNYTASGCRLHLKRLDNNISDIDVVTASFFR